MRDKAIDITKAIGILLMILGHCAGIPEILRNFIFSFHMPLFFILSGYFYKPKEIKAIVAGNNKHLLKPYLITSLVCIVLSFTAGGLDKALAKVVGTIMSNGGWPHEMIGANLPHIGPIWFLMALYWCKIFYEYLRRHAENTLLWTFVISTIALVVGKYVINLPFGILTGFCGMVFYAMGDYWRRMAPLSLNKSMMGGGLLVWMLCVWRAHLELASFDCSWYPISMFAAFVGTYATYLFAKRLPSSLEPVMCWIGQNTLLILCYHTLVSFLISNLNVHILTPIGYEIDGISKSLLRSILSIALPYIHVKIYPHLKSLCTSNPTQQQS